MVLAFLRNNQARIVDMLYERIHQTTQAEAHFMPNELRDNIARGAAAFLTTLETNDPTAIDHFITDLIAPAYRGGISVSRAAPRLYGVWRDAVTAPARMLRR